MEHENEHLDIREKLLRLPKVQADDNFLKRLQIQIDILDSEERTRDVVDKGSVSGYFKNLFGARLMPALGISSVIAVAVLVYFVLADKKDAVVNNMTGNKTQETIITPEKPGITNSAPTTENKQLAKTEETDSKDKTSLKTQDNIGTKTEEPRKVVADERNLSEEIEKIKNPEPSSELRGITTQQPPVITSEKSSVAKAEEKKKSEDKISDAESNTETLKPSPPTATKDQEKSVNEGGRGNTDTKTPKSSIKPKKKDLNGVIDINKSVLESLRDKLK